MGAFLTLLLQFAESFLAQNAATIEAEVIKDIEAAASSLFKTATTVKTTGTAPPVAAPTNLVK